MKIENVKTFCKGILFAAFLFVLYNIICPTLLSSLLANFIHSENFWISNLASLSVYVITFLIVFLIVRKDIVKQFHAFRKEPKKYLRTGFTYWGYGIVVMIVSNLIASSIVQNIAVNEQVTREILFKYPLYAIPSIVFFGPFLEELVFRYAPRKAFQKELPYALFSAFIFGLLHVLTAIDSFTLANILAHIKEFLFIIPYGSLGYFFAKSYYETDNIFSSAIPHMLHNSFSVALILLMSLFS